MSKWRSPDLEQQQAPVTIEQGLYARLQAMHDALIDIADANGWAVADVDAILRAGGLPEWSSEYVVTFSETAQHQVRVRATTPAHASEAVHLEDGQHLVAVRLAPHD